MLVDSTFSTRTAAASTTSGDEKQHVQRYGSFVNTILLFAFLLKRGQAGAQPGQRMSQGSFSKDF